MVAAARSHTPKGQRARAKILVAAEGLFATRGFHGTSMRDLAAASHLPLATVVYHFARKERLYGAVLGEIADDLGQELDAIDRAADPSEAFARTVVGWTANNPGRVKLVLRELLDNPARVARASQLPLAPFLERAARLVGSRELAVLHLIGGLSYVIAAWPTVTRMIGPGRARRLAAGYERAALAFARRVLAPEDRR